MAWLQGFIVSRRYRESGRNKASRDYIIYFPGIESRESAELLVGSPVEYRERGLRIRGIIIDAHGGRGEVRARFRKGLPGVKGRGRVFLLLRPEVLGRVKPATSSQTA